ncbi:MAG TPA: hypothetical protein VGV09_14955 [Steroidobacteraceae bacterium]|nr:hypothetical protein [Steroidobacteraceae bacterium]
MRPTVALTCSVLLAGLLWQPAQAADDFFNGDAQTPSPITDHFALRASFFHATVETDLRLDPPGIPLGGTPLLGTRDLGFRPSENDGMAELIFRLRDRNRMRVDFLELSQAGTKTLTSPILFGDQLFSPGAVVVSSLQWRVMGFTWTRAIIQNDRFELGLGLGVHLMDMDVRGTVPARFASYETSTSGALPTPALESALRITRRISLTARVNFLKGALNSTFGEFEDVHADAQFRWVPNLAIGAGYSVVRLKVDSVTHSDPGLLAMRLRGPEVFVRASF